MFIIPIKNRTIEIRALVGTGKRSFQTVASGVGVYMNQRDEEPMEDMDNSAARFSHKMLADADAPTIEIGWRIVDETGREFIVKGKNVVDSPVGSHVQYELGRAYD